MVHSLSGGEKARLLLTKLAMKHDNFLILDEPTNHLDIDSKEVLEQAIKEFDGTILLVSHDRYFINKVATSVLEIAPTGSTLYLGDYDYYVAKKEEQAELAEAKAKATQPEVVTKKRSPRENKAMLKVKSIKKWNCKLTRKVAELEAKVEELDENKTELEQAMALPENFNDLDKMAKLQAQLETITAQLAQAETDWENSSMELENFNSEN